MKKSIIILTLSFIPLLLSCDWIVNRLAFYPDKTVPHDAALPPYAADLWLISGDGVRIHGLYFTHAPRSKKAVIYFHGNAGNAYHRVDESMKLYGFGCDVLLLEYRGYGKSGGSPSEKGIYLDGECMYDHAVNKLGYNPRDIFIYGRSLGTAVAVEVAGGKPLAGVILVTPFTSARDMAGKHFPSLAFLAGDSFKSIDKINGLKSPVLVIHGTSDEVVPYGHGLKLFGAYRGIKEMVTIEHGRHNDLEYSDPEKYWGTVENFLSR